MLLGAVCFASLDVVRTDADLVGVGHGVFGALVVEVYQVAHSEADCQGEK